jgi:hypothetical protein
MYRIIQVLVISAALAAGAPTPAGGRSDSGPELATQLLAQARAALGGEEKLRSVRSLSASGKMRRNFRNREQSGEVHLDLMAPDKLKLITTVSIAQGIDVSSVTVLNGNEAWRDTTSNSPSAPVMAVKAETPADRAAELQEVRAAFARYMLGLLLTAPESIPLEFSYVGEAEAPEGRADVLGLKGLDGFQVQLFLDKKTHLPLLMSYKIPEVPGALKLPSGLSAVNREVDKAVKQAQAEAAAVKHSEIQLFFSDYRAVDGLYFPHRLTRAINGQTIEEWEMGKFKINPQLKPERFAKN